MPLVLVCRPALTVRLAAIPKISPLNALIVQLGTTKVPQVSLIAAFALLVHLARRVIRLTHLVVLVPTPLTLAKRTSAFNVNPARSLQTRATSFVIIAFLAPISPVRASHPVWDALKAKLLRKARLNASPVSPVSTVRPVLLCAFPASVVTTSPTKA